MQEALQTQRQYLYRRRCTGAIRILELHMWTTTLIYQTGAIGKCKVSRKADQRRCM